VLAAVALYAMIGVRPRRHAPEPVPDAVRRMIAESEDSEANLALLGDKAFLIDDESRAALAYGDTGRSLVACGDPTGEETAARALLWRFREMADREGKHPVYYAVSGRYVPAFLDMGLAVLKFGEGARVDLTAFSLETPRMKDFRQARNRALREGFAFEVAPPSGVRAILPELREVSDAWLARKQGVEKGFSLGAFDEDYLANFPHAVLRAPENGEIIAFANLLPGARVEVSVDLMRYYPDGPKFAMDALFGEIMLWGKAQGFRWFNLGATPLAGMETHPLASPWLRIGGFVYSHGERFYNFEGLRAFKEKFDPVWSPHYIVTSGGLSVPRAFLNVNALVSGGVAGLMQKDG